MALQINPNLTQAHAALGELLHKMRKFNDAEKEYRMALALDDSLIIARLNMGTLLTDMGKFIEARKWYFDALNYTTNAKEREIIKRKGSIMDIDLE